MRQNAAKGLRGGTKNPPTLSTKKLSRGTVAQKKSRGLLPLLFHSSLSGVQTGIPSGPSGGIPSPSVGSELRLCRPFATLFYLSTLPSASPSLPSAVGHSSVAVGIGNNTEFRKLVNPFFENFLKKFFSPPLFMQTNELAEALQEALSNPLCRRRIKAAKFYWFR